MGVGECMCANGVQGYFYRGGAGGALPPPLEF